MMRGSVAVVRTRPKAWLVSERFGTPKLARLITLNTSHRNSNRCPSRTWNTLGNAPRQSPSARHRIAGV